MRKFSHILSFLALALFVLAVASSATANTVDPSIIVQNNPGPIGTNLIPGTTFSFITPDGFSCNFTSPAPSTNDCAVRNTNPGLATWTAVDFDISQNILASLVSCGGGPFFASCVVTNDPDGTVDVSFTGGLGIPVNTEALIGIAGWDVNTTFDATITLSSVPEPGTLALLLTGGGFFLARRRRQNVFNA